MAIAVPESGEVMPATRSPAHALLMPPIGIAPRFPKLQPFLKSYTLAWTDWETASIPDLQRYGAEGTGFAYGDVEGVTIDYGFNHAGTDLERVAMSLRWQALQAALFVPGTTRKKTVKVPVRDLDAAIAVYRKQTGIRRYFGAMQYAASYLDEDNSANDLAYSDDEMSNMDKGIAWTLAEDGYAVNEIAQAILACSPHLGLRKDNQELAYARDLAAEIHASAAAETIAEAAESAKVSAQVQSGADWRPAWQRAVAYGYWACQMRTVSGMGLFHYTVGTIGNCLILGWHDWAISLARRATHSIARDTWAFAPNELRTQYFLLRLIDDWQGHPDQPYPPAAYDDPLFVALLAEWRNPDPATIAPLLLEACDRHTHHARPTEEKSDPDFPHQAWWYDPFEILAVLYLRSLAGLANPVLEHPLLATPIGVLPAAAPRYHDALLETVIHQASRERPALLDAADKQ